MCGNLFWDLASCEFLYSFSQLGEVGARWWLKAFGMFRGGVTLLMYSRDETRGLTGNTIEWTC